MALRSIYLFIIFLLGGFSAQANSIFVFGADDSNYPIMKAKAYIFDNNNAPIEGLSESSFSVNEKGQPRIVSQIICPPKKNPHKQSVVLSIDISGSMSGSRIDFVKSALKQWTPKLIQSDFECAVTAYNTKNYLYRDFTSDPNKINSALDNLNPEGGSNFNSAFLDYPAGALLVAEKSKYQTFVVFITDGNASGDEYEIVQKAIMANVAVYCISLAGDAPQIVKNIARLTGGLYFENVNNSFEFKKALTSILSIARGILPCEIYWSSWGCEQRRTAEIAVPTLGIQDSVSFSVSKERLPHFEFSKPPFLTFGEVEIGSDATEYIAITARNADIDVFGWHSSNAQFSIDYWGGGEPDFTLKRDSTRALRIRFAPLHKDYNYARIEIISSACAEKLIVAAGGSGDRKPPDNTLKVVFPNGGEYLSSRLDTAIAWSGVMPDDTIRLEYSVNSGLEWHLLSDSATGLSYNWAPPNINSEKCLIRAVQLSKNSNFNKVKVFKSHAGKVISAAWKPDGSQIVSGSDDGTIRVWDALSVNELKVMAVDLISVLSLDWSADGSYIAASVAGESPIIYDAINFTRTRHLEDDGKRFTNIKISSNSEFIAGCATDGSVYIWRKLLSEPIYRLKPFSRAASGLDWKPNTIIFSASGKDGAIKFFDASIGSKIGELPGYENSIDALAWDVEGRYLAVAGESENIDIWNMTDFENPDKVSTIVSGAKTVHCLNYSPDRKYLSAVCSDSTVKLWQTHSSMLYYSYRGHLNDISCMRWNNNASFLLTASHDYTLHKWSPLDIPFEKMPVQTDISDTFWTIEIPSLKCRDINFDVLPAGDVQEFTFNRLFENEGKGIIRLDSVRIDDDNDVFELKTIFPRFYLKGLEARDAVISFKPAIPKNYSAKLTVYTHFGEVQGNIEGRAEMPAISVLSDFIDFGKVTVGDTVWITQTALMNNSQIDITIDSVTPNGPNKIDYFISSPKGSFILPGGESQLIEVGFAPSDSGRTSGILDIHYDGFGSPARVGLFGQGAAPVISADSIIQFDTILCAGDYKEKQIQINNAGSGKLRLYNASLTGIHSFDFILTDNFYPIEIASGSSSFINIRFNPSNFGAKTAKLSFATNLQWLLGEDFSIELSGFKDSVSFQVAPELVSFGNVPGGAQERRTAQLFNTGYYPLYWHYPPESEHFTIEKIEPLITSPGTSSTVTILFKGSLQDGSFSGDFRFADTCGAERTIILSAFVGGSNPEISTLDMVAFPRQVCENTKKDTVITISNNGTAALKIIKATLIGRDAQKFELGSVIDDTEIAPGSDLIAALSFTPVLAGRFEAILELSTNAVNFPDGIVHIQLSGAKDNSSFDLEAEEIDFGDVEESKTAIATIEVINTGTIPIKWSLSNDSHYFRILSVKPEIAPPGSTSEITAEFIGASEGNYSHTFEIIDSCGNMQSFVCIASVSVPPYFIIYTADMQANAGDKTEVLLKISNPKNVSLNGIDSIKTRLSFNSTLLVPLPEEQRGLVMYPFRIYEMKMPLSIGSDSIIARIGLLATLGNSDSTELMLESAEAIGANPSEIRVKSGVFRLADVCYEGGARLIGNSGRLWLGRIVPNPVVDVSRVEFSVIEKGKTQLSVYDLFGRKVWMLFDKETLPGIYSAELNLKDNPLPTGSYILELKTKTDVRYSKFTIMN